MDILHNKWVNVISETFSVGLSDVLILGVDDGVEVVEVLLPEGVHQHTIALLAAEPAGRP